MFLLIYAKPVFIIIIAVFRRNRMDNNNKNKDPNHNRQGWGIILITTLLVTFMVMGLYSMMRGSGPEQISYDKFLSLIDEGEVQEVNLNSDRIYITLTDEARQKEFREIRTDRHSGKCLEPAPGTDAVGQQYGRRKRERSGLLYRICQ